jgi:peptidoglycan hydrolase CwlO-like protein
MERLPLWELSKKIKQVQEERKELMKDPGTRPAEIAGLNDQLVEMKREFRERENTLKTK